MFSEEVEIFVVNEEDVDKDGDSPGDGDDGEEVDGDLGNKVAFQSFQLFFHTRSSLSAHWERLRSLRNWWLD